MLNVRQILIFLFIFLVNGQYDPDDLKLLLQTKVLQIAINIEEIYQNKCKQQIFQCQYKSYNSCQGTAQRQCLSNFPSSIICQNGIKHSLKSGVRIPNTITIYDMSNDVKYFLCKTAEPKFTNVLDKIIKQNKNIHSWAFFGSNLGILRVIPSKKASKDYDTISCSYYDPRFRPWFVQNVYKSKKMIILVQNSYRIHSQPNRYLSIQLSIQALLKTAKHGDYFNIIQFSDIATVLLEQQQQKLVSLRQIKQRYNLQYGDKNFYQNISNRISKSNSIQTDYYSALSLAMRILQNSKNQNQDYQNLIIMFAGFQPTGVHLNTLNQLQNIIKLKSQQNDLIHPIFFGFGVNLHDFQGINILHQLSCIFNGIYIPISDLLGQSMFLDQAKGFYDYLIQGNKIDDYRWTRIYKDSFGLGNLITVTKASYYQDNNVTKLIGVAGIDLLVQQLEKLLNDTELQYIYEYKERKQTPFKANISFCVLQILRGQYKCSNTCNKISKCENKIFPSNTVIFQQPVDISQNTCCSHINHIYSNQNAIIGVVLSITLLMIFGFIVMSYYCFRKQQSNKKLQKKYKLIFQRYSDFDQTRIRSLSQISDIKD